MKSKKYERPKTNNASLILSSRKEEYVKGCKISEVSLIDKAIELSGFTMDDFIRYALREKAINYIEADLKGKTHKDILIKRAISEIKAENKTPTPGKIRYKMPGRVVSDKSIRLSLQYLDPTITD